MKSTADKMAGWRRYTAPMLSLGLIAGVWVDWQSFHVPAGDAGAYHSSVREMARQIPERVGDWVGTVVEPPPAAIALLRPNVLLGRDFRNVTTGEHAVFAFVQCQDARDMAGHWPPVCYPTQGWTLRDTEQRSILVRDRAIPVSVYHFTIESIDRYSELVVYNFFVRPDGELEADRASVRMAAEDLRIKLFGAAQVQVAFDSSVAPGRRDEVFSTLVAGVWPAVDAVLGGVTR